MKELERKADEIEQVRKVLSARKAPTCLLTLVYAYGINTVGPPVHKCSLLGSTNRVFTACIMLFILDNCRLHVGQVVICDKLIR